MGVTFRDCGRRGFRGPGSQADGVFHADKKCPFTGDVSIRGRILTGRVVSTKMTRTIIIRRDYLHYIPKYSMSPDAPLSRVTYASCVDRYEKRHKNLAAHVSPAFRVDLGDSVTVGMCYYYFGNWHLKST